MSIIVVGEYTVTVPDEYAVEEFNQFRDMPDFFRHLPFDWNIVRQTPTVYTVRFGEQWLSFHALPFGKKLEGWTEEYAEFLFSETGTRPQLEFEDVVINGIPGKSYGGFTEVVCDKKWWLMKPGSHVICFCFQGKGPLHEQTKSEVEKIMSSVRGRIREPKGGSSQYPE